MPRSALRCFDPDKCRISSHQLTLLELSILSQTAYVTLRISCTSWRSCGSWTTRGLRGTSSDPGRVYAVVSSASLIGKYFQEAQGRRTRGRMRVCHAVIAARLTASLHRGSTLLQVHTAGRCKPYPIYPISRDSTACPCLSTILSIALQTDSSYWQAR